MKGERKIRVNKEVPDSEYYIYKGCIMDTFAPGLATSMLWLLDKLDVDYLDDPEQSCCTGFAYHQDLIPPLSMVALNIRNYAKAEEKGYTDMVSICPTSYATMKDAWHLYYHKPKVKKEVDEALAEIGIEYKGTVNIYQGVDIVHHYKDKLAEMAEFNLNGLRVATHHGCHYTKCFYEDVVVGDWEYPEVLDQIAEAFGAQRVDYQERTLCCGMGFRHLMVNRDYTRTVNLRKLRSIKTAGGADLILCNCVGCYALLDWLQTHTGRLVNEKFGYPVLTYAQLAALLLGADPYEVAGIQCTNTVPLESLFEKIGIKVPEWDKLDEVNLLAEKLRKERGMEKWEEIEWRKL